MTLRLVPIEDLANTLTVSITTVRAWVRTGLIPGDTYVKIGNTYRFDKEAIINHFKPKPVTEVYPTTPVPEAKMEQATLEQLELDFDVDANL